MKSLKAIRFIVLFLAAYILFQNQELADKTITNSHRIIKREFLENCSPTNCSTTSVDIFVLVNDIDPFMLPEIVRSFSANDFQIDNLLVVEELNLTTVCYPLPNEAQQCHCEDELIWSEDICEIYGRCTNLNSQNCSCINGIPRGEHCVPYIPIPQTIVEVVIMVETATVTQPLEIVNTMRDAVENIFLPLELSNKLTMTSWNLTTACYQNSIGSHQCQCEDLFEWPCDFCDVYDECNNASTRCGCIGGIPPFEQLCGPISTILPCRDPVTTTEGPVTQRITERVSFTLDIDFDESYNSIDNEVNMAFSRSMTTQAEIHIAGLQSVTLLGFSAGSTIGAFEIVANTTIQDEDVEALLTGMFNDLKNLFPVVFESRTRLLFEPRPVFFGETLNVTCGPPPRDLDLSITSTIWTLDDVVINEDGQHTFSQENGMETLTINNFFFTDDGFYECSLFDGESSFRSNSRNRLLHFETPRIILDPLQDNLLCEVGQQVSVQCSVQAPYEVVFEGDPQAGQTIESLTPITQADCDNQELNIICETINFPQFRRTATFLLFTNRQFTCVDDPEFGNGFLNSTGRASCEENEVGQKTAICRENGEWEDRDDNCTLQILVELLLQSQFLNETTLPEFLEELSNATTTLSEEVTESQNNIGAIVTILDNVASFVTTSDVEIIQESMEDVLLTTSVLTLDNAIDAWNNLNREAIIEILGQRIITPRNESVSSLLLFALEGITSRLSNASFNIETPLILLNKTSFINNFNADFNSTVEIDIQGTNGPTNLTVITFESLDNVLPPRDENNATGRVINGRVVLVQSDNNINNISFNFDIINETLERPQCVFWNFSLFEGLGGWDDEGCELIVIENDAVTCQCDHLTSFSILMSPHAPNSLVLDYITYIGVGISILSLIICLCIEAAIWRKVSNSRTAHLRHICIVNIALSLLIANIWFIVGAGVSAGMRSNPRVCTAVTFFIHLFYLALFFWMLNFGLLLFYYIVNVFGRDSKSTMLAIGFSLGYGAPLLIATITIAVTAPVNSYIQETAVCWLNWSRSMALLAFVIPALLIVFINLIILFVMIVKLISRRGLSVRQENDEKDFVGVLARTVAILTPFFGITWSLGVGTLTDPENLGLHATFALFNSLQGLFILVFGTLLDNKVRSEMSQMITQTSTTNTGSSSQSKILNLFGKKGPKNVSNATNSSRAANSQ
ncbi:adhesion G protein-coupled receptor F5-like [Stigmatopora argus]